MARDGFKPLAMRMLEILQVPELPSLKENDIGTKASLAIEAHPDKETNIATEMVILDIYNLNFSF